MAGKRYKVEVDASVIEFLSLQSKKIQRQISRKIDSLAHNPRPPDAKQLKGVEGVYRIRSGDYRILYQVQEKKVTVFVIKVGHRKDIY